MNRTRQLLLFFLLVPFSFGANDGPVALVSSVRARGPLPLVFEPNQGQAATQVRFVGRSGDYAFLLTGRELVLSPHAGSPVRMQFAGAKRPRSIRGQEPTGGISNYLPGPDPAKWRTHIPNFAAVRYDAIYPGIDLVFHGGRGQLEYDFIVAPGGDTRNIRLEFKGTSRITLDNDGNLLLSTGSGLLRQWKPVAYQESAGKRTPVEAQFRLSGSNHVAIHVSAYDRGKPLIIDPVISFSATLPTSLALEFMANMLALDSTGNVYIVTSSPASGPVPINITKLDPTLSTVLYTAHFGPTNGTGTIASGVAVDSAGSAYVTGITRSTSFPTTPGAYQTTGGDTQFNNTNDAFLTKLSPAGDKLVYSTYLGGSGNDLANCIAVDASGSAYVGGSTLLVNSGKSFPTTPGAFQTGTSGGFVTKFTPDGSALAYSTLIGGGGTVVTAIVLDSSGNAYVAGITSGPNVLSPMPFPTTPGAFQTTNRGANDGFISKLNSSGSALLYSTLLGGSGNDYVNALAVDASGNAYVAGTTSSINLATTASALQPRFAGGASDAFVAKLSSDATSLLYATYLGGSGDDKAMGIAVNNSGNAIVAGSTTSLDFPLLNAFQSINATSNTQSPLSAYITKLDLTGSHLLFSSYLGGIVGDYAKAVTADQSGNAYIAGLASSPDFPVTPGTTQTALGGSGVVAFLTKVTDPSTCTFSASAAQPDDSGGTISITAQPGCFWYIAKPVPWVNFAPPSGLGNGSVTYTYGPQPLVTRSTSISAAGQLLTLTQPGTCKYQLDVTATTIPGEGGQLTPVLSTGPECTWTATSNAPWMTLGISGTQAGSQQVPITVAPNTTLGQRVGTVSVAGLTFTVTQPGGVTTMSVTRSSLNFGVSGPLATSPQAVGLIFAGPTKPGWTASTDKANITVFPTSGTGSAVLRIAAGGGFGGHVTITAPGIPSLTIQVNIATGTGGPPFGSFDTPTNGNLHIVGAIPVTGWALDSIEVSKVDIWRDPIANEPTGSNGLVYIGDAVFVEGARPDVESANPTLPLNYRAGWGYQMLTNFLPNGAGFGMPGTGSYKLHAIAHNTSGATRELGTKVIGVENVNAIKPFGTIDTPAQGATISGADYVNFGWALTPQPGLIPKDGSTITVVIDGVAVGHPTYDQFRSDIASLFPGYKNTAGAVGFFHIDTTQLANGVHTISWNVFDNLGNGEGLGSRYFNVLNGAGGVAAPADFVDESMAKGGVRVHHGLSLHRQTEPIAADSDGGYSVTMDEVGLLELHLGASSGSMLAGGEARALPTGSTLKGGVFYWQPGPGFLGEYTMQFERPDGTRFPVRVTIVPKRQ